MAVFLTVLKIIGIVLLCILGLLLLLLLLILFWPFGYRLEASKKEDIRAKAKVSWLLHLIVVEVLWQSGLNLRLKLFGLPVYDHKRRKAKAAAKETAKEEKAGKKAESKKKKEDSESTQNIDDIENTEADTAGPAETNSESGSSKDTVTEAFEENSAEENAEDAEADEDNAFEEHSEEKSEKPGKKKKKIHKGIDGFNEWLEKQWDRLWDFLDRAPEKLADWLEYLPDKAEELIETIEYYDRLLNSDGTEWVIEYVKKHGGAMLFHILPYRTDGTLDYYDDDPGNVAKIYEYQVFALPILDRICCKHVHFDILALQDEKKVELTLCTKGRIFVICLVWHAACLLLNKKVRTFLKRLRRREE